MRLTGMIDFDVPPTARAGARVSYMTIERADTSIRYRQVTFQDPEETLIVPTSIDTVTVIRNSIGLSARGSESPSDSPTIAASSPKAASCSERYT